MKNNIPSASEIREINQLERKARKRSRDQLIEEARERKAMEQALTSRNLDEDEAQYVRDYLGIY